MVVSSAINLRFSRALLAADGSGEKSGICVYLGDEKSYIICSKQVHCSLLHHKHY
jgi:hypothetical protein